MMKLDISAPSSVPESGSVPVTWCADRDLLESLARHGVRAPHVLIVTAPKDPYRSDLETRTLVPLTDGICYIYFRTDGPHHIHAMVVWPRGEDFDLKRWATGKNGGEWRTDLLDSWGRRFDAQHSTPFSEHDEHTGWALPVPPTPEEGPFAYKLAATRIEIEVPEHCFAKPPPAWLKKPVEFFFSSKEQPVDQCDFRRLLLFTIPLLPVLVFNFALRVFILLLAKFMLFKDVSWDPVRHFFSFGISSVGDAFEGGNYLWVTSWDRSVPLILLRWAILPLNPLWFSILLLLNYLVLSDSAPVTLSTYALSVLGDLLTISVMTVSWVSVIAFWKSLKEWISTHSKGPVEPSASAASPPDYLSQDTIAFLVCDEDGSCDPPESGEPREERPPDQDRAAMSPKRERTFREALAHAHGTRKVALVFQATKAEVCKPFAR